MSSLQFSERSHAEIYSIYRPDIPEEIALKIVSFLGKKFSGTLNQAVDVGCGSGQSTVILAQHFQRVTGIDTSHAQIDEALKSRANYQNISFKVGPAEVLPFDDQSVQLVTACASLHWFQTDKFFSEVNRILAPNGVFAAYTYHFVKPLIKDPVCTAKIDSLFQEKCNELLPHFSKEVSFSLKKYDDICFPFKEVVRPPVVRQTFNGTLENVMGYIESLSGFQNLQKKDIGKAERFISDFFERLKISLEMERKNEDNVLELCRDFYIILCRK